MIKCIVEFGIGTHGKLIDGRDYSIKELNRLSFDTDGNFKRCTLTLLIEGNLHKMEVSEFIENVQTAGNDFIYRN